MLLTIILLIYHCNGQIQQLNVHGLVAAVFSPFDENGRLNLSVVEKQAAFLNSTGVEYAFIAGTTGESVSLLQNEREELLEQWLTIASHFNLKIIVHVGANCIRESRSLVVHAISLNSSNLVAFASMAPSYFKPATIAALTEVMKTIAAEAPLLPFYFYHIPSMTGVEFSMYDFITFAGPHIPNLAGVKFTGLYYHQSSFPDVLRLMNYNNNNGRTYEVMTGRDEMMIQCLVSGVKGFVGSQYNFAGELYNNIILEYNNGNFDKARKLQLDADNLLIQVSLNVSAGTNGVKYMMVEAGVPVGDPRLPYIKMNADEMKQEEINTLNWCQESGDALTWCKSLRQKLHKI